MKASVAQALLFLSFSVMVSGQTPPAFHTTTRLVQINVIASDKNGPVEGLTKEDFVLYDEGKKQNIVVFEPHVRRIDTAQAAQTLAPNEFTNVPGGSDPGSSNAVLIVWDTLNTPFADQARARPAVLKSLSVVWPGDRVGIYILGSQFTVIQDFTSDSSQLIATLDKYAKYPDLWGGAGEDVHLGRSTVPDTMLTRRMDGTRRAVWEIMNRLAGVPGRKCVIWIAARPAFAVRGAEFAIYMVDARGLQGVPGILPEYGDRTPIANPTTPAPRASTPASSFPSLYASTMQDIAESTGGTFVHGNDIRAAIDKAIADGDVTYTLGFYPQLSEKEIKSYHNLKVTVKRRGVSVHYPKAYDIKPYSPPREQLMINALANNLDFTQLRLTARLERDGGALRLPVTVSPEGILLQDASNDRWKMQLDYVIMQRAGNGSALDTISRSVTLDQNAAQREAFLKQGFHLTETLAPKPGLATIKIVVLDRNSGTVGSLCIPVPPEDPTAPTAALKRPK